MEKEDKVWYEAFLRGDQESFGKLILKYQKRLIYFINQIVKNIDVSEDLAEDVFVYMLIHQKEYDFKFSFQTYLYTIGKSRAINYIKKEKRVIPFMEGQEFEDEEQLEEIVLRKEKSKTVRDAIGLLPVRDQELIYLIDFEKMSYQEVRQVLGKTLPQVKMGIFRARNRLKEVLRKEEQKYEN